LVATPFAAAGQVVVANGGDLGKEFGLYPPYATQALPPQAAPLSATNGAVPPGTVPGVPYQPYSPGQPYAPYPPAQPYPPGQPYQPYSPGQPYPPYAQPYPPYPPQPYTPYAPGVCNGDEQMSFNPGTGTRYQQIQISVTSARPSANVSITGSWSPAFQNVTGGGKGTIWNWTFTPNDPGDFNYTFYINGVACTNATVHVNDSSNPPQQNCNGDESLSFEPANPLIGQRVTIRATSARPSVNVALTGPGNPAFQGAGGGGKGTTWTWQTSPLQPGRFTYNFTVSKNTCATGTVNVGLGR